MNTYVNFQDPFCLIWEMYSQTPVSCLPNWRRRPGRPRHTWLRTVAEDLRQFNLGLASGLWRAQNRTAWRTLAGTATSPTSSDWWLMKQSLSDIKVHAWINKWNNSKTIKIKTWWFQHNDSFSNSQLVRCRAHILTVVLPLYRVDVQPVVTCSVIAKTQAIKTKAPNPCLTL